MHRERTRKIMTKSTQCDDTEREENDEGEYRYDGAEAEELRSGLEALMSTHGETVPFSELQALLDRVDARDSLHWLTLLDRSTTNFVECLFKMQNFYEGTVDEEVMDFLGKVHNAPEGCSTTAMLDLIHAAEGKRHEP